MPFELFSWSVCHRVDSKCFNYSSEVVGMSGSRVTTLLFIFTHRLDSKKQTNTSNENNWKTSGSAQSKSWISSVVCQDSRARFVDGRFSQLEIWRSKSDFTGKSTTT